MGRIIGGVIVGYLAMVAFVFLTFTLAYFGMGADGAFLEGTFEVSTLWIVTSIVLGFLAAILGGMICVMIARQEKAAKILALVVLLLGIAFAIPAFTQPATPGIRVDTEEANSVMAMQNGHQPPWIAIVNPLIGAVGVMVGGCLRRKRK
jgi:ABC-type Na+ efflux pump permease subunit